MLRQCANVLQVQNASAMCLIIYRCQMVRQCAWLCVTGVKCFRNLPDYVLQVANASAMCLIIYRCQMLQQCAWLYVTGVKCFGNVYVYV